MPQLILPDPIDDTRRNALAGLASAAAVVLIGGTDAAQAKASVGMARALSWYLGGRLSIATNVYFRSPGGDFGKYMRESDQAAAELGVSIPPLPPRPKVSTDGLLKYLEYFNQGDGAKIKAQIADAWGREHATLFQAAAKLLLLSLVYDLDPKLGDKVAATLVDHFRWIGLPNDLWQPPIDAVAKRESADAVKKKAIDTYFATQTFLLKGAGGR